jgi:hypothetical protein
MHSSATVVLVSASYKIDNKANFEVSTGSNKTVAVIQRYFTPFL